MEETEAKREKTQRALDCTRTVLHKTEGERAEQVRHFSRVERPRAEGAKCFEILPKVLTNKSGVNFENHVIHSALLTGYLGKSGHLNC